MNIQDWLGNENKIGLDIWEQKYRHNGESFDEWLDRISNGNEELKIRILDKKFLFGGRILSNRGLQNQGYKITYSNCFNLGEPEDTIESIFDISAKMARTYSAGGGCGVNLGKLRPRGSKVHNNAKFSTGVVPFMDMYSKVTETIGQENRRGALMIILPIDHPDVEEFIKCKANLNAVLKANISVFVTDEFMLAVENNEDITLRFFVEQTGEKIEKTVNANELFKKLAYQAWDNAEPGVLFKDRIQNYTLMEKVPNYEITGTNPCGEIPMPSMSACLLGSINLSEYVIDPFTEDAEFDFESLREDVKIYVKALNECLEENIPFMPLKEQEQAAKDYRAIGLGYFGLGDLFIKLGMRYGSKESINLSDKIGKLVARESIIASDMLFDYFPTPTILEENENAIYQSEFYKNHFEENEFFLPVNTSLLTCAPTGTLSTMLGVSGGIEPIFSLSMMRKTESLNGGKETWYEIDIPVVQEWKEATGNDELPEWITNSTSMNLKIEERIEMQATWQKHIDNAISSTVNLADSTTVEQVMDLYINAWEKGLKGVTVYRSGCKRGAILTEKKEEKHTEVEVEVEITESGIVKEPLKWGETISCSNELIGLKRKIMSGCGSLHIGAFYDWDGRLQEVFFNKGSDGGCNAFMVGLSRMTSLAARTGASVEKIVDQLASVPACASYVARTATKHDTSKGKNCPNAIGNALMDMQKEIDEMIQKDKHPITRSIVKMELIDATNRVLEAHKGKTEQQCIDEGICPLCYQNGKEVQLIAGQGCFSCSQCGYSKCE